MKKLFIFFGLLLFSFSFAQVSEFAEGEVIIKVKQNYQKQLNPDFQNMITGIQAIDEMTQQLNVTEIKPIGNYKKTGTFLIKYNSGTNVDTACLDFKNLNFIAFAEPNYKAEVGGKSFELPDTTIPNDAFFNRQWGLYNDGSWTPPGNGMNMVADADVDMELAWDIETGDPNMIIAVSDSGMNFGHTDIAERVWQNEGEIAGDGIDNDGNGYIDDFQGWNWAYDNNNISDDHGHGTNCGGIIGAISDNNKGYAGGNWNSKLMNLKCLNSDNTAYTADMANSLYYAVDMGAKIVSMSIGGSQNSSVMSNAVQYMAEHNVILVACMMNFNNSVPYYPAAYSLTYDNVIAVGSTDGDDRRTKPFFWDPQSGSNYGSHISVVAPGNFIYGLSNTGNGYSTYWGGTSQATPLVAAIASLVLSVNPQLTPAEVRNIIQQTAEDQVGSPSEDTAGFDIYYGWGRANAHQAVLMAQQTLKTTDVNRDFNFVKILNPVKNNQIELINNLNENGNANFSVYDFSGKKLMSKQSAVHNGLNKISVPGLPKGNYILKLEIGNYTKSFKIVVQ